MGVRPGALESVVIAADFWGGRSVLVTGHTGFKGGWLCWWLRHLGAEVTGLALCPPTTPSLFEVSGLASEIASVDADVRDREAVNAVFREHRPEVVFHLAAQSLVRESYRRPIETFSTNVMGTVNCLDATRECASVRAIVVVTTDKCYRNRGLDRGYREEDELGGDDPYSASKACAELVTDAYRKSFFASPPGAALVASARAGNVIGGGDWASDRLLPDAIRAFAESRPLSVRHPDAIRPWQHVLEPLHGYLVLAEHLHRGNRTAEGAWNFGPDPEGSKPVSWLADMLTRHWGQGAKWRHEPGEHLHEAALLSLDSSKARKQLGWRPLLSLDEATKWTLEWYQAHSSGRDCRALTLAQIRRYQERCTQ